MKTGLVLGGGGLVGLAYHAGVLRALEVEAGFAPDDAAVIVGTSAGSVIGAYLRSGMTTEDIWLLANGIHPDRPAIGVPDATAATSSWCRTSARRSTSPGAASARRSCWPGRSRPSRCRFRRCSRTVPRRHVRPGGGPAPLRRGAARRVARPRPVVDDGRHRVRSPRRARPPGRPHGRPAAGGIGQLGHPGRSTHRSKWGGAAWSTVAPTPPATSISPWPAGCDRIIGVVPMAFDTVVPPGPLGQLVRRIPARMLSAEVALATCARRRGAAPAPVGRRGEGPRLQPHALERARAHRPGGLRVDRRSAEDQPLRVALRRVALLALAV